MSARKRRAYKYCFSGKRRENYHDDKQETRPPGQGSQSPYITGKHPNKNWRNKKVYQACVMNGTKVKQIVARKRLYHTRRLQRREN